MVTRLVASIRCQCIMCSFLRNGCLMHLFIRFFLLLTCRLLGCLSCCQCCRHFTVLLLSSHLYPNSTVKHCTMAMQGRLLTMANAIHSGNSSYELGKVSKWAFHGHYCNQTAIFEWCVVRCGSTNGHQKRHLWFKRDWTTCSKLVDHPRLNSQHNGEGPLYYHFLSSRIITLIMSET